MKKFLVSFFLLFVFTITASAKLMVIDSVETETNTNPATTTDNDDNDDVSVYKDNILFVPRFDAFVENINNTITDSTGFYDWVTDDIHQRKFDFSEVKDTLSVVLNDSTDHYTPPVVGIVTSEFGKRKWRYHYGTDIDLNTGDTVLSAFNGKVRISTYSKSYGNVIVIRHNNGLETIYGHLSKRLVDVDSVITSGTVIGLGGNTGRSHGSHLHFELRLFDEALDPRDVIDFENCTTHQDILNISKYNFAYKEELKLLKAIQYHSVKSGNTLGQIANKYGTSITTLCRLNGISRNKILQIGEKLRVR